MRTRTVLLGLLSLVVPLSVDAAPPAANAGAQGVPFNNLQEQIDALAQRVQALEAASPAGQACPPGQFVTGFTGTGAILCAPADGSKPPANPPTPPAPIPQAVLDALQQGILALAGQNVPFQTSSPTTTNGGIFVLTTLPKTYSLTFGAISFTQPNAVSLAVRILVPAFSITADVSFSSSIFGSGSGTLTIGTTNAVVNLTASVVDTPGGLRRLGAVGTVNISPGDVFIDGTLGSPAVDNVIRQNLSVVEGRIASILADGIRDRATQILSTLPDF
jgi:hypothetical protein